MCFFFVFRFLWFPVFWVHKSTVLPTNGHSFALYGTWHEFWQNGWSAICAWVSVSLLLNFGPRHFSPFTFPYILFPETCGVATPLTWNVSRKSYRTRVKFTADNTESGMCSQELPLEFNTHFIFGGKSITSKSCWVLTLDCVTMRNYAIWSSLKGNKGV